jgi:hypothetical protein
LERYQKAKGNLVAFPTYAEIQAQFQQEESLIVHKRATGSLFLLD